MKTNKSFKSKTALNSALKKENDINLDCGIIFHLREHSFSKIISKYTTEDGVLKIGHLLKNHLIVLEDLTKDCFWKKEFTEDIDVIYGATDIIAEYIDNIIGDVNINKENQSRKKEKKQQGIKSYSKIQIIRKINQLLFACHRF